MSCWYSPSLGSDSWLISNYSLKLFIAVGQGYSQVLSIFWDMLLQRHINLGEHCFNNFLGHVTSKTHWSGGTLLQQFSGTCYFERYWSEETLLKRNIVSERHCFRGHCWSCGQTYSGAGRSIHINIWIPTYSMDSHRSSWVVSFISFYSLCFDFTHTYYYLCNSLHTSFSSS